MPTSVRALARRFVLAIPLCVLCILGIASPSFGQGAERPIQINLQAGDLADSLEKLGEQSGVQIMYQPDLARGIKVAAVIGSMTVEQALAELLRNTKLRADRVNERTVVLKRAESSVRPAARTPDQSPHEISGEGNLTEIVVTAQKREERLQNVPISISVLKGAELDASTFLDTKDALSTVPGMANLTNLETGGTQLSLRGVSASAGFVGGSTPIAYYVDGVPFALIRSAYVPDANVFDLQRIEVLSGPQGTLYGASALNGVVRVITNDADLNDFDFKGRSSVSTTDHGGENYDGDMAINIPIIEGKLAMRIVAGDEHQSGWIDTLAQNHSNDVDVGNERLKINAQPTDTLSMGLSVWHSEVSSGGPPFGSPSYQLPDANPMPDFNTFNAYGLSINDDLPYFSVSSTTSYLAYSDTGTQDFTPLGGPVEFWTDTHSKVYSEELNFTSRLDGPWQWSGGLFYRNAQDSYYQNINFHAGTPVSGTPEFADAFTDTSKSEAVYGEVVRSFLEDLFELSAGVRYFHDDEGTHADLPSQFTLGSNPNGSSIATASATTPRAVFTWKPSRDLTAYASYGQGFRSGIPQDYLVAAKYPAAQPDKLTNYEVGIKGNAFDQRLVYTAAAYYIHWAGVQQQIGVTESFGGNQTTLFVIANGQSASGPGAEFSVTARPVQGLDVTTTFSWNDLTVDHTIYSDGAPIFLKGDRLNLSPEFTGRLAMSYTFPLGNSGLKGQLSASENYTSVLYSVDLGLGGAANLPSNSQLIARARFSVMASDHWTISLFGDNLANYNGVVYAQAIPQSDGFDVRATPRTVGMRVDYHLR